MIVVGLLQYYCRALFSFLCFLQFSINIPYIGWPVVALATHAIRRVECTSQGTQIKGKSLENGIRQMHFTVWLLILLFLSRQFFSNSVGLNSCICLSAAAMQHDILGILNWIQATMYDLDLDDDHRQFLWFI